MPNRDVAPDAGVSLATVSQYKNKNAPLSVEVVERLQQVMSKLRYGPHAAAQNLASRESRVSRILFLRGLGDQEDSLKLETGYQSALQVNGIPRDEKLLLNGDFERNVAYRVLKALHAHGIRVPEDVAVVGFDDLGFAPFLKPRLTTVRAPTERLFELLENHPPIEEVIPLPTEIIFRRPSGCDCY